MPKGKIPKKFGTPCRGRTARIISIDRTEISSGMTPRSLMREFVWRSSMNDRSRDHRRTCRSSPKHRVTLLGSTCCSPVALRQADAGAATILGNELDAALLERSLDRGKGCGMRFAASLYGYHRIFRDRRASGEILHRPFERSARHPHLIP
jgi:hypothetical protein